MTPLSFYHAFICILPPMRAQVVQMQKAVCLAITIITAYFTSVGVFGYLVRTSRPRCASGV